MKLSNKFLEKYEGKQPEWGFGDLSYFTYKRTYARVLEDGRQEEFFDTCRRVTEATFTIQEKHCRQNRLPWNAHAAQKSAQEFFSRMWAFKFLPPGRGLWMMGTELVDRIGSAALQNCAFRSTKNIDIDLADPFAWTMDMLMLGVGVGFDTKGAGKVTIKKPSKDSIIYIIPDSREGWVESVRLLISSFQNSGNLITFDYSLIRKKGEPIKGFGGVASGPEPLIELHNNITNLLSKLHGEQITSVAITDIMNMIGRCVVAGNVRRSAELAIGELVDHEFITMKDFNLWPEETQHHRWASNNSVFVSPHSDFSSIIDNIALNGEPGLIFIDNARHYGRFKDGFIPFESERYDNAEGFNPCKSLQSLILTPQGYITFEQALKKDSLIVITPDGKYAEASKPFKTGTNRNIWKVILSNGLHILGTENHQHKTISGWTRMDELKIGDRLPYISQDLKKINISEVSIVEILPNFLVEDVYDITVFNDEHAFIDNGIISHNCVEQPLEDLELCNLVETFPANHEDAEDYLRTLKFAYMYSKTVTLIPTHHEGTNSVMMRNRRIGCSMSGVQQAIKKFGLFSFLNTFCDKGYAEIGKWDRIYSKWLGVPRSIRTTTLKPSGTVSILAGATPGVHWTHSEYYLRTIRLAGNSPLLQPILFAGYRVEPSYTDRSLLKKALEICGYEPTDDICEKFETYSSRDGVVLNEFAKAGGTVVVYFPVKEKNFSTSKFDISIWEQLGIIRELQHYWADNSVSCTVTFKEQEKSQLKLAIELFAPYVKALSFLPLTNHNYRQAPYQEIDKELYNSYASSLESIDLSKVGEKSIKGSKFCTNDNCEI